MVDDLVRVGDGVRGMSRGGGGGWAGWCLVLRETSTTFKALGWDSSNIKEYLSPLVLEPASQELEHYISSHDINASISAFVQLVRLEQLKSPRNPNSFSSLVSIWYTQWSLTECFIVSSDSWLKVVSTPSVMVEQ